MLIGALRRRGFTVIGPRVRSQAIVYDEIASADELPAGVEDVQDGGTYRLRTRDDGALFAHTVGHDSVKRFLFPPVVQVWRARRAEDGTLDVEPPAPPPRYAFLGVRSCDLHAVAIQDRVFLGDRYVDPDYEARREDAFFVAVNCARAGGTCFCVSMDTGPAVTAGHDLALTELSTTTGTASSSRPAASAGATCSPSSPARPAAPAERRLAGEQTRSHRRLDGSPPRHRRHPGPARRQRGASALGRRRRALPELRQLHDGLPDVLLQHGGGHDRPDGRRGRAHAAVGLVLHAPALLHARRQRAQHRRAFATASG